MVFQCDLINPGKIRFGQTKQDLVFSAFAVKFQEITPYNVIRVEYFLQSKHANQRGRSSAASLLGDNRVKPALGCSKQLSSAAIAAHGSIHGKDIGGLIHPEVLTEQRVIVAVRLIGDDAAVDSVSSRQNCERTNVSTDVYDGI
jgi:hypothetical protein